MKNTFILIALLLLSVFQVCGQDSLKTKTKDLCIGIGMVSYHGDLGSGYGASSLMGSVGLKLNNQRRWNGNLNLSFGQVSGQELDYQFEGDPTATPNSYFNTVFFSFNFDLHYNFINRPKLKIYLSQGIGLMRFNVKDQFSNSLDDQSGTRVVGEEYRNLAVMIPTQLGFKYLLPNAIGIGIQGGFYNIMTDYIDNISQWGNTSGNDNLLSVRFHLYVPLNL